jgi:hypothetical protein
MGPSLAVAVAVVVVPALGFPPLLVATWATIPPSLATALAAVVVAAVGLTYSLIPAQELEACASSGPVGALQIVV